MALADRRPHKFPVNSTLSSPSFNPKTLDSTGTIYNNDVMNDELIIDEELGNLDVNDSHDDEFDQNIDGKNLQNTRLRTTSLNKSNSKFLDNMDIDIDGEGVEQDHDEDINEDGELQEELDNDSINSLSPMDNLSPTSRSISPDSLMNSDQKLTSNSSRSSTPNGSGSGSGSIYKQSFNPSAQISQSSQMANDAPPSGISSASQGSQTSQSASQGSQSLAGQNSNSGTTVKKPKNTSRVPIATGISTTIPVTGEKPKPSQKDDASLEDDVLYAIFLILFEKDPEGKGMTVKQICDILIDRHPEMANLSTKTSNLVSAKLNAYVKRVEKGDSSLKYALSRDWADASPKRMVYVYRGLLTDDFHIHVKNMMESQKQQEKKNQQFQNSLNNSNLKLNNSSSNLNANLGGSGMDDDSFEAGKQASLKPRRQTMFDLGINRNSFLSSSIEKSNLFVPYNSAPVTASLKDKYLKKPELQKTESQDQQQPKEDQARDDQDQDQDNDHEDQDDDENDKKSILDDFEVFNDNDNDKEDSYYIETLKKNGKRSKSMSYLTNKKHKILTAAAAAPRAPKTPCSHSPNAAAAAAALHAAALKAINNYDITKNDLIKSHHNIKWLNVIRSGFLSTDIGTPEDISVSDLDKYF